MAREFRWYQFSYTQEFLDTDLHSIAFGAGDIDITGQTLARLVGRAHFMLSINSDNVKAKTVNWGLTYGNGAPDPINAANSTTFGQRWKIWSSLTAACAPSSVTAGNNYGVGTDSYDFDVHGQVRMNTGTPMWVVWRVGDAQSFSPGEIGLFTITVRAGYLLPG